MICKELKFFDFNRCGEARRDETRPLLRWSGGLWTLFEVGCESGLARDMRGEGF